jgi:hypothetical protein
MGRQNGLMKLTGNVGDLNFYETMDGYLVRRRSGLTRTRFQSDPAFTRSRENAAEFGCAARAAKLLRTALHQHITYVQGRRMNNRLLQAFLRVAKSDLINARGGRNVSDGDIRLLRGFDFNERAPLSTILLTPITSRIDRDDKTLTIGLGEFVPATMIAAPPGSTHCVLTSVAVAIDFVKGKFKTASVESAAIKLSDETVGPIELLQTLNDEGEWFLLLGVSFYQERNGELYALNEGAFNPLSIVEVDKGLVSSARYSFFNA